MARGVGNGIRAVNSGPSAQCKSLFGRRKAEAPVAKLNKHKNNCPKSIHLIA